MSWRNLKIFALAVLIVINAVFMWLVSTQYSAIGKYTDEEIDNVVKILENNNIHIQKSIIDKEKKSPSAYEGKIDINKLISIWDDVYSNVSYELNVISGRSREGNVSINNDMLFTFVSLIRPGKYTFDKELFERVGNEAEGYLESFRTAVFGDKFFEKVKVHLVCTGKYTDENGFEYVRFQQVYNGYVVNEGDINCVFIGGKMIYAEGLLIALEPNKMLSTDCVDILSVLVKENGRVSNDSSEERTITRIVNGVSYVKNVKDSYYLVPTYRLIYSDETESVYDAITGDYLG